MLIARVLEDFVRLSSEANRTGAPE
jgi:hypothetical protein